MRKGLHIEWPEKDEINEIFWPTLIVFELVGWFALGLPGLLLGLGALIACGLAFLANGAVMLALAGIVWLLVWLLGRLAAGLRWLTGTSSRSQRPAPTPRR